MSLTRQTITITSRTGKSISATMPAEHIFPFIIHRALDEYLEKQSGERTRYSKKYVVTHLLTGGQLAIFPNYKNALAVVRKIKNKPIFLMPTIELLTSHPDWRVTNTIVGDLKARYAMD